MAVTRIGRLVVDGTDSQVRSIRDALAACRFPVADRLPQDLPVSFKDLRRYSALGLFWTSGRIEIEQELPPDRASQIFLAEAWHAIDQYLLTSGDRARLYEVFHGSGPDGHTWFDDSSYRDSLGEQMMDVFLLAYSPYGGTGLTWGHETTQRVLDTLTAILSPSDPLSDFPREKLDDWARRSRAWWPIYSKAAARDYLAWKARHGL